MEPYPSLSPKCVLSAFCTPHSPSCLLMSPLLSLSLQATFKGWMDIMYAAVDSREVRG